MAKITVKKDTYRDSLILMKIANAIREKLKVLPGAQVVMAQPISARVAEMVTGVRSDVAVKVFGDDLALLKQKADEIARVAAGVPGAIDIRVERVTGQQYLSIEIDRDVDLVMLHDPGHSLDERILREQFGY